MTNVLTRNKASKDFSRVPKIKCPRSVMKMSHSLKTALNASYLTPICCQEVMPGDTWETDIESFARISAQVVPVMDNLYLKTYFFFVPSRLLWDNFTKQHGERLKPDDSIDYITPKINSGESGFAVESLADYFGIPTGVANLDVNALPFRAYNMIYNDYFRDENLQDSLYFDTSDADDDITNFQLMKKAKVHDYFTSCLPTLQKGDPIQMPLGDRAPVLGTGGAIEFTAGENNPSIGLNTNNGGVIAAHFTPALGETDPTTIGMNVGAIGLSTSAFNNGLYADLSNAVAADISALRQMIATQELLERDNRNGTRYTEMLEGRYGVTNPDLRLQRPQYLGGTSQMITSVPVVQTSGTGISGSETPQGNLTSYSVVSDGGRVITQSFGEWGYIIGLACVTSIPSYQQGLHKKWSRMQRYDYYYPEFINLSDQPVLNKEIYAQGASVTDEFGNIIDDKAFGFQERYAEYKYEPNEITGKLRSTYTTPLDVWHYAEKFDNLPTLSGEFIKDPTSEVLERSLVVTDEPQIIADFAFDSIVYRPMPETAIPKISSML